MPLRSHGSSCRSFPKADPNLPIPDFQVSILQAAQVGKRLLRPYRHPVFRQFHFFRCHPKFRHAVAQLFRRQPGSQHKIPSLRHRDAQRFFPFAAPYPNATYRFPGKAAPAVKIKVQPLLKHRRLPHGSATQRNIEYPFQSNAPFAALYAAKGVSFP